MATGRRSAEEIRHASNTTREDVLTATEQQRNPTNQVSLVAQGAASEGIQSEAFVELKEFTLFNKLPLELQRMVWRHAANVPHVVTLISLARNPFHHLTPLTTGRTRILEVCQEARAEASKELVLLEPDKSSYLLRRGFGFSSLPPIFFNTAVDTVWIDPHSSMSGVFGLIWGLNSYSSHGRNPPYVRKLAFGFRSWYDSMDQQDDRGDLILMSQLAHLGTEEVILVVGDIYNGACKSPDVVFIEPENAPSEIWLDGYSPGNITETETWDLMNAAAMKYLTDFQAQRGLHIGKNFLKPWVEMRETFILTACGWLTAPIGLSKVSVWWRQRHWMKSARDRIERAGGHWMLGLKDFLHDVGESLAWCFLAQG